MMLSPRDRRYNFRATYRWVDGPAGTKLKVPKPKTYLLWAQSVSMSSYWLLNGQLNIHCMVFMDAAVNALCSALSEINSAIHL